jgi:hypothetical protein
VARRRLTVKRIDPWSVLKFGVLANVVLLVIFMMIMGVVWFIIDRLQIVDQICGIATDVGFTQCGINAPNLFRSLILLGLLWVVIQSAVLVFFAFLYNLISDLVGGIGLTIIDDTTPARVAAPSSSSARRVATADHQRGATHATGGTSTSGPVAPARAAAAHPQATAQQPTISPEAPTPDRQGAGRQPAATPDAPARTATRARDNTSDDDLFGDR